MERYGSDKPDLRYGLELRDLRSAFASTEVKVFRSALDPGGTIKALVLEGRADMPRKELDGLVDEAKALGAGGLVWAGVTATGERTELKSPLDKFFTDEERAALVDAAEAKERDLVLIVADPDPGKVHKVLGGLRVRLADRYGLIPKADPSDPAAWRFAWILDFPWFEYNEDEARWDPIHHPFTGIVEETMDQLESDPSKVISKAYDITLNGWELGSGSIRIHERDLQERVLAALGIGGEEAQQRFGFLLDAFRFGPPPHGGIATGIDRTVALVAESGNIRDVVAFPKTQTATDPLTGAPGPIDDRQLKELYIRTTAPPPDAEKIARQETRPTEQDR